jgi:hypothetical protein
LKVEVIGAGVKKVRRPFKTLRTKIWFVSLKPIMLAFKFPELLLDIRNHRQN